MKLSSIALLLVVFLTACGYSEWRPKEKPLPTGSVEKIHINGHVSIINDRMDSGKTVISKRLKIESTAKEITQVMVNQITKEIEKNSYKGSGVEKTIGIEVLSFWVEEPTAWARGVPFVPYLCRMYFVTRLGDGYTINREVRYASSFDVLNGCMAESVRVLLSDSKVRDYLKK